MLYGVRFCGGCNPRYDRGKALEAIRQSLGDSVEFEIAQEDREYDGLLVIGGCSNCCPAYKHFKVRKPPTMLCDENHIEKVIDKIKEEAD